MGHVLVAQSNSPMQLTKLWHIKIINIALGTPRMCDLCMYQEDET